MNLILRYIVFLGLILAVSSCNIKRHVYDNQYLLKKNIVHLDKETQVDLSEVENVIRQRPNHRTLGFRFKLRIYNSVDSLKVVESKRKQLIKYRKKNENRIARQDRKNENRIQKALKKGDSLYVPKVIELKDTLDPKKTLRERIKYSWGEPPVILDTSLMEISADQIHLFMQKKGYFDAEVATEVEWFPEKKEAIVNYHVTQNDVYYVDTIYIRTRNLTVKYVYDLFMEEHKDALNAPFRYDSDNFRKMRKSLSEFMRDMGVYGFKDSYISFEIDTLGKGNSIHAAVIVSKRIVGKDETEREKPFAYTKINNVTFHLLDTMTYKGNFKQKELDPRGITLKTFDQIPTFDTLRYDWYKGRNADFRGATFLYNGKLTTRAELIEYQNYLEENNTYGGKLLPQSYNRLINLNVFKTIKPEIIENEDNTIDIHYYLTPQKRHSFSFEPKATHNNSFLGVSASLNYVNRNLFRRGYLFTVSLSGGFESQPEVFGKNEDNTVLQDGTRSFNTLEFGPSVELEMPGLFPIPLVTLSKRQNPRTIISTAYNFQQRPDFKRQIYQFNYLWKFSDITHNQVFTVGIPVIGGIQFLKIDKTEAFKQRLEEQNDLFLLNAYSNQAIFKDLGVTYSFTNPDLSDGKLAFNYRVNFDLVGMVMALITKDKPVNSEGYKEFLGQRYSQFTRLDNQIVFNYYISKKNSLHYRLQIGVGVPLLNNGPNLPFDYSFFGGGSNDNRGFRARSLGPGVYKYYLDSVRSSTQLGDMRLGTSLEYRFKMSKLFEGALFSDIGNVWGYNEDPNRPGSQISKDFYKQLSISAGLGLRLDFTFLIVRLDVGVPLRNPALPAGARWIFQDRDLYYQEGIDKWGINPETGDYYYKKLMPKPFRPQFHVAIGYPF